MVLSRVVSEIFNVEKYRDLELQVKGQTRSCDLENRVRGPSRLMIMIGSHNVLDRAHMTSY